jgi:SAM-dependent methyltransferase
MMIKKIIKNLVPNESTRHHWVSKKLLDLEAGGKILDAGCGTQRYKPYTPHLKYYAQDFGEYSATEKSEGLQNIEWDYGNLDYQGNCWEIDEENNYFDSILCTEVIEHIPFPNETISEFSRLLKPGGFLILTAPYACLPHMQPYFYYSGFSKEWYEEILIKHNFEIEEITPNGNFYMFLLQENIRSLRMMKNLPIKFFYGLFSLPKLLLDYIFSQVSNNNQLVFGYHVCARKKIPKK